MSDDVAIVVVHWSVSGRSSVQVARFEVLTDNVAAEALALRWERDILAGRAAGVVSKVRGVRRSITEAGVVRGLQSWLRTEGQPFRPLIM